MPTKLAKNVLIAVAVLPVLWYFGILSSFLFQFLQTLILVLSIAVWATPKWPDSQMDLVTAMCLHKEKSMPKGATTHLSFAYYFDECPTKEDTVKTFQTALDYERFTSVPVLSPNAYFEASWQKVSTKIEDHIDQLTVESTAELEQTISKLTCGTLLPLVPTRPLWRVVLIQNTNGKSCLVWLLDHALGDGIGLLPFGLKMMTTLDGKPYVHTQFQARKKGSGNRRNPLKLVSSFFSDFKEVLTLPDGPFDSACELTRNSEKAQLTFDTSKRELVTVDDFNLKDIVDIKNRAECTVNDVFTALWAGTLRRYLQRKGDPILKTPEKILLRGQAPFSHPRPVIPGKTQNSMSFVVFKLPVGVASVRDRLKAAHEEFEGIKNSFRVPLVKFFADISIKLGLDAMLTDLNLKQWHRTSFIFSNVQGPNQPLMFCGKHVLTFKPYYCNLIHQAIFFSYGDKVSVAMVIDTENIKEPALLGPLLFEELEAMKKEFL